MRRLDDQEDDLSLIVSIILLLWVLLRSGAKPSRVVYPCQRAAVMQVSSYFYYLLPLIGLKRVLQCFKSTLFSRMVCTNLVLGSIIFILMLSVPLLTDRYAPYRKANNFDIYEGNIPSRIPADTAILVGSAAAQCSASRVVSVHDSDASNWNHVTGQHWEYIDQGVVDIMFAVGLMALTGGTNTVDAWNRIIPYRAGDEIAIKFNFNNSPSCASGNDNQLDGLSETANAIINGLTSIGVPPQNIWIYDAMRRVVPTRFILGVDNKNVRFFGAEQDGACGSRYYQTFFVSPGSPAVSGFTCQGGNLPHDVIRPAQVLVDAEHLINVPIFRSHGGMASFALKNHYGSVFYYLNDQRSMHDYFDPLDPAGDGNHGCDIKTENILADINNNPHIRNKTRLIIGEGIFGHSWDNMAAPIRYTSFDNNDPNIYFFGVDSIAVSSVMADSLNYERLSCDIPEAHWPSPEENHEQLHAGALLGLGVHEHWDSPQNRQYPTIDYVRIDLDRQAPGACSFPGQ